MKRSSNGTYANFLILDQVLEVNFHPDIVLNQTVINQVGLEKNTFMLAHQPLPELYDISSVKHIQLEGSKSLDAEVSRMAVYTGNTKADDIDRIREINGLEKSSFKVFQDKDKARAWLSDASR